MTRISNADHVLLLLQEQLDRLGKTRTRGGKPTAARTGTPEPMTRLRALVGREGLSEEDLKRALLRGLLAQQLGDGIANDPAFEAVAGDVMRIIGGTAEGRALLDRALAQLTG